MGIGHGLRYCVLKHFSATVNEEQVSSLLTNAMSFSEQHIQQITTIFNIENIPLPEGFSDRDVDLYAPAFFSDNFYIVYFYYMKLFYLFSKCSNEIRVLG